jgi:hypothetical protein
VIAALALARRLPWRLICAVAVVGLVWWQVVAYGDRREAAGRAAVKELWVADEMREQAVADAATNAARLQDAADAARNQEVADAHAKDLAAATADRDRYRGLLQRARAAASAVRTGETPSAGDVAPAGEAGSAAETGSLADRIDAAIADALVEARQNAAQLDALVAVVRPQM